MYVRVTECDSGRNMPPSVAAPGVGPGRDVTGPGREGPAGEGPGQWLMILRSLIDDLGQKGAGPYTPCPGVLPSRQNKRMNQLFPKKLETFEF